MKKRNPIATDDARVEVIGGSMKGQVKMRWTLGAAALEFAVDKMTLSKRLRREEMEPGPDGKFSTLQIVRALFGSIEGERQRKLAGEADRVQFDVLERRGLLVPLAHHRQQIMDICLSVRGKILATNIPREDKEALLAEIKAGLDGSISRKMMEEVTKSED